MRVLLKKTVGAYNTKNYFFIYYNVIEMTSYIFILQSDLNGSFIESRYMPAERNWEKSSIGIYQVYQTADRTRNF